MQNTITINPGGRPAINPRAAFVEYINTVGINNKSIVQCLSEIGTRIKLYASSNNIRIDQNAFNKANGDWYEWFISIAANEFFINNYTPAILVNLPNISSFEVTSLYKPELHSYIIDLREKLNLKGVNLVTSNPDFCIIRLRENRVNIASKYSDINFSNVSMETLDKIDNIYRDFIGYAELDDIAGYLSVKTSLRPDRRLQLAHEGSLMKAIYTHLQTRTWTINPKGVKYYGAATQVTAADVHGLKTVATHSIADVKSLPQSAVDKLFTLSSVASFEECFSELLSL